MRSTRRWAATAAAPADATPISAATGAFINPDPVYLQSTGFVLDPTGYVAVSGQFSHGGAQFHAPAPAGTHDAITDFSAMAEQMRQTYANEEVLSRFEASLGNDALAPQPIPISVVRHRGLVPPTLVNRKCRVGED